MCAAHGAGRRRKQEDCAKAAAGRTGYCGTGGAAVRLLLEPGDVLAMYGEARYEWTHGIDATMEDEWDGGRVPRGTRVSITLRRVCVDGWVNLQPVPELVGSVEGVAYA